MNHLRIWNQRNEIDHHHHHHHIVVGGGVTSSSSSLTTTTTSNESPINEPVTPVVLQSLDDMMIDTYTIETIPAVPVLVDKDEIIYDTINTCKTSYYYYSIRSLFRNHRKYKLTDGLTKIPSSIKPDETISTTTNNNDDDNIYGNMNHHTTLHGSFNTIPSSQDQTYNVVDTSFMDIEKNEEKCNTDLKKKSVNVTIETNNIHMNDNDDETNNTVLETPSPTNTDDEFDDDYNNSSNTNYGIGNDDSNRKRMNQKFFRRGRLV